MAGKSLQSIRGIHDGLPAEVRVWQRIEAAARKVFASYAFSEVRLPVLEPTELFVRSIGEATDIVSKEMYAFTDQGNDHICLRPEGTAGSVRAYLQGGLTRSGTQRWFYVGPMFRRERPQKGRLRQFQQIGVEMFGASGPLEDVEMLAMAHAFLSELGISGLNLEINSLGCSACRPAYRDKLVAYLNARADKLCETCNERIEKNPMRVLDCKVASCQAELGDAPEMVDHLCDDCESHFTGLKQGLDALAVPYRINARIVRGLDYYNRTAFEIVTDQLGAQGTVLAGGRYDGLVQELGGPPTQAIGFAAGLERLAMLLAESDAAVVDVAVAALGEATITHSLQQAAFLRSAGLNVVHCGGGSAKRQFKVADREAARFVVVIGEDEMNSGVVTLKNLATGEQQSVPVNQIVNQVFA
ncbi:histidyl-tRNA synthetase [Mariprofundus micogutta]|uniref:Histidine--tRNA ligase n=1 Tax=Mariprofundus micogutta TaxID=1921010 RepID=A0A1L8CM89_9PROT|nr:histidine--tRNA ligase [Mariprofundus micogutta]GAV20028.1 histidyl-tRNA synthetase [Mariprofundus micogutta]